MCKERIRKLWIKLMQMCVRFPVQKRPTLKHDGLSFATRAKQYSEQWARMFSVKYPVACSVARRPRVHHAPMGTAVLSVPAPQRAPLFHSSYATTPRWSHGPRTSLGFSSSRRISFLSSSSSSSSSVSVVEEESNSSPPDELSLQSESDPDDSSFRGCKACGREEIERGCNGEGRIQGGIATVPGFGWWPIKAYRPCPGFVASGGRYKRRGQSMDEVTSGGARSEASASAGRKDSSSKKKSAKG